MKSSSALKTIGEVSKDLEVPVYVVRFWEKKFKNISPIKKSRGMRYFDQKQILLLMEIKNLLYTKKYSIEGAKKVLSEKNISLDMTKVELISELENLKGEIEKYLQY